MCYAQSWQIVITSGKVSDNSFKSCAYFLKYTKSRNMPNMKKPKNREELIRTEISVLSLPDPTAHQERIVSARRVSRCNISHRKSLFEKQINKLVESNYSISEMATLCNMSVTTFKHRFAEYYELSPHRWLVKLHLHKAMELLLSEDLSIKEICHKCHFSNQSQFTNRFKREYGLTPTQYRKKFSEER